MDNRQPGCSRDGGQVAGIRKEIKDMPVKIKLDTNFAVRDSLIRETDLPSTVRTVRDLMKHVGGQIGFDFFKKESGELKVDLEILLNGKEIWFYPNNIDMELKDGDEVVIYLVPLGGG
jgi:hypothetical protein